MKILAMETTGKYGSASVTEESGAVYSASSSEEMNHLKGMISLIDEAVCAAGITKKDLTHIAASAGPGSFTGIRIGVTTARTMAQMLGLPCISVSSLEALAKGAMAYALQEGAVCVAPIINARRHQTYAAAYRVTETSGGDGSVLVPLLEEKQYMIEEFAESLRNECAADDGACGRICFTGDGIDAYKEVIESLLPEGSCLFAEESIRYQHSAPVAEIALAKALAGETLTYRELLPEYMRLAEAEQRLRAGTLSDKIKKK